MVCHRQQWTGAAGVGLKVQCRQGWLGPAGVEVAAQCSMQQQSGAAGVEGIHLWSRQQRLEVGPEALRELHHSQWALTARVGVQLQQSECAPMLLLLQLLTVLMVLVLLAAKGLNSG